LPFYTIKKFLYYNKNNKQKSTFGIISALEIIIITIRTKKRIKELKKELKKIKKKDNL
jgi:hypothetical protein